MKGFDKMKVFLLKAFDSLIEDLNKKRPTTNGRDELETILKEAKSYRERIRKSNVEEVQIVLAKAFYERHGYKVM